MFETTRSKRKITRYVPLIDLCGSSRAVDEWQGPS